MKLTVAVLLGAVYLAAQTGGTPPFRKADPKMPGEPGVMHPLPVPKTTPVPAQPDAQPDAQKQQGTKSASSSKKKASDAEAARKKKTSDRGKAKSSETHP